MAADFWMYPSLEHLVDPNNHSDVVVEARIINDMKSQRDGEVRRSQTQVQRLLRWNPSAVHCGPPRVKGGCAGPWVIANRSDAFIPLLQAIQCAPKAQRI